MKPLLQSALVALLLGAVPALAAGDRPTAIEYGSRFAGHGAVLTDGLAAENTPSAVALTADGAVWFRESLSWHPRVARFGPDGSFHEFWDPFVDYRPGASYIARQGGPGAFTADGDGVVLGRVQSDASGTWITRMGADGRLGRRIIRLTTSKRPRRIDPS